MAPQALSDEQVQGELKKMTSFIMQEALEKAKEIRIKADEEFQIEKARLVQQESTKIDHEYEAKVKKLAMSQQIARSTVLNKTRLRVLAARQEILTTIVEDARGKLDAISQDKAKYSTLMTNLILQGLYTVVDSTCAVVVREADKDIAEESMKAAAAAYKKELGKDVKITLADTYLPKNSAGGVVVTAMQGKITVDNTLEERLRLLEDQALPELRTALFGSNPDRKFTD